MAQSNEFYFYKMEKADKIWWVDKIDFSYNEFLFSFDKKEIFNLFSDYPWKLTKEQKEIFDEENPEWKEFFKWRERER